MDTKQLLFKKVTSPFHVFKALYPEPDGGFTSPVFKSKYVIGEQYETDGNIEALQGLFSDFYSLGRGLFYGFTDTDALSEFSRTYEKYYGRKDSFLTPCLFLVPEGATIITNENGEIGTTAFRFLGKLSQVNFCELIPFSEEKVESTIFDITSYFGTWTVIEHGTDKNVVRVNLKIV